MFTIAVDDYNYTWSGNWYMVCSRTIGIATFMILRPFMAGEVRNRPGHGILICVCGHVLSLARVTSQPPTSGTCRWSFLNTTTDLPLEPQ